MEPKNRQNHEAEDYLLDDETDAATNDINEIDEIDDVPLSAYGKPKELPPLTNGALMQALDFTEADLRANQQGFITRAQKAALYGEVKEESDAMWLILMMMLGVTLLLAVIMSSQGMEMLPLVIGAAIIIGPMMWISYNRQKRLRGDAEKSKIARVRGPLHLHGIGRFEAAQSHVIQVGKHYFYIRETAYRQLSQYDATECMVYYVPQTRQLLSIEVRPAYTYEDEKAKREWLGEEYEKPKNDDLLDDDADYPDRLRDEPDIIDADYTVIDEPSRQQKQQD